MKPFHHKPRMNKLRAGIMASTVISGMGMGYAEITLAQEDLEEVVVTGSRIVRRDFDANSPIMTVDEELFDNTSNIGIENVLNQLPQFIPAVTQFDSQVIEPNTTRTPGASTLSLRGLGSNRNLVLVDGRRGMPVNASGAIDVNMIPSSAIQRVETITGGASSVYGADAMAGVVNFILKNNYEGMELSYQYGITDEHDGQTDRLNGVFGANFGDTGNVLVGFEYSRRRDIKQIDRQFYRDGFADRSRGGDEFFWTAPGIGFASATGGTGANANNNPSQGALDSVFPAGSVNALGGLTLYMNPDGTAYGLSGAGQTSKYKGEFLDENGNTFRKFNDDPTPSLSQNQLNTLMSIPMERYAFFARGRMDVTDNVSAIFQGTMAHNQNNTILQFTPLAGSWAAIIPHGNGIYADSLEADGVTTKAAYLQGGLHGLNCAPTGGCTNSQAFPVPGELGALLDARTNPNEPYRLEHVVDYAGPRTSSNDTFTYQLLAGLEGDVGYSDWTWDASMSYGFTNTSQIQTGFASVERFRALMSSPNYGRGFYYLGNDDLPFADNFGGGIGSCTTGLPAFEFFTPSDDCLEAIRVDLRSGSDVEQKVAEANVQGRVMDLPAGELRFAAGAHYRENNFDYRVDGLNNYRSFLDSAAGLFPSSDSQGSTRAREVYTEFLIPALSGIEVGDVSVIQELNFEAGFRYSDMEPSGSIETWKVLFDWQINDWARLRGGKQVANRAPNIAELYQSPTQGFGFSFIGDLCSENNTHPLSAAPANANGATVRAMCETLMGPTGSMIYYDPDREQPTGPGFGFLFANTIGNDQLKNETADTITFGGVFNLMDRTTLTVDWYQIEIEDMIALQSGDSVFTRCFDPATNPGLSLDYYECQKIERDPSNGGQAPIDITYSNQAQAKVSGIDVQLNWGTDFWNGGVNVNLMASFVDEVETRQTPTSNPTNWKGTSGIDVSGMNGGWYDYRTFTTFTYFDNSGWNTSLTWRYLPSISTGAAATGETTIQDTKDYSIFDLSAGYRFGEEDRYLVSLNINNLLDEPPEFTGKNYADTTARSTGLGTTSAGFYDVIGRQYSVRLNVEF